MGVVLDFIKAGKFPDILISKRLAIKQGMRVFRHGHKCGKCGVASWRAVVDWSCLNCRRIKMEARK